MRPTLLVTTVALALLAAGCSKEPASIIVEKVKRDGAGEVENASLESITQWMWKKGTPYADALVAECEPFKKAGGANWNDSTEGRICTAARSVQMNSSRTIPADPRKY